MQEKWKRDGARRSEGAGTGAGGVCGAEPAPSSPSVCSGGTGSGEPAATETEVIVEPGSIRKEIPEGVFLIDTYNEVTVPQSPLLQEGKCWMLPEAEPRSEQQQSRRPRGNKSALNGNHTQRAVPMAAGGSAPACSD